MLDRPAALARDFAEDDHERVEARRLVGLVAVLGARHGAGREVGGAILRAAPSQFRRGDARRGPARASEALLRMYRPGMIGR